MTDERAIGDHVRIIPEGQGVATLRVDRPPVNALNAALWDELADAARHLHADSDLGAVVLWGGPKVFAAGADVPSLAEADHLEMNTTAERFQETFRALAELPQITIAAINGWALGGGCELALTADFRFAAHNAQLGQPEVHLGLMPGAGGTQRLPRLVGVQKAKEMVYRGDRYRADAAQAMGLVDEVHPAEEVHDAAVAAATRYAAGPYALRYAKRAIDDGIEVELDAALRLESRLFASCFTTEDARTGLRSFLEEGPGKATFQGR